MAAVERVKMKKTLEIPEIPAPLPTHLFYHKPAARDDLGGIDFLSPEFEMSRVVLTRTLKAVRPLLYAKYRTIKDGPSPAACEDAYAFAFGALAKLTETQGQV